MKIDNYLPLFSRKLIGTVDLFDQKLTFLSQGNRGQKVLLNSFPKSGTHLLDQVLTAYPSIRSYNRFSTHASSFMFREKPMSKVSRTFDISVSNELVKGHLRHTPELEATLKHNSFLTFFLYRDPRDVIASEAHYLRSMNPWHRLHRYFSKTSSIQEAIDISISGLDSSIVEGYPDFGERFVPFLGWLDMEDCVCVRFEDFVAEKPVVLDSLKRVSSRVSLHFGNDLDPETTALMLFEAIDPNSSHTFRAGGGQGKWRSVFTPKQEEFFNNSYGHILERLGY